MQEMTLTSWSDFKTLVSNKTLLMQYSAGANSYEIFAPEAGVFMWHITLNSGTSDYTDFENNFKASANAPLMLNGATVEAPNVGETAIFDAVAIRNTSATNSSSSSNIGYRVKTVMVNNGLDQAVSIQCQGSRDGTNWINIGTAWSVATATWTYQSCDTYFPYMRAVATCSVAPTTGTLSMWLEKVGV
jgi:hypothetical protein